MRNTNDIMDSAIIEKMRGMAPSDVFDYGCGDTNLTMKINALGHNVTGFDISDKAIESQRAKEFPGKAIFLTLAEFKDVKGQLDSGFDVVVCSLVLCIIREWDEVDEVVRNIHALLKPNGSAIIGFCNPLYTFSPESEIQRRIVPHSCHYTDCFEFKKIVKSTGRTREEFHRPLHMYETLFVKHGLAIVDVYQTAGRNPDLNYVSDFIIYKLAKGGSE